MSGAGPGLLHRHRRDGWPHGPPAIRGGEGARCGAVTSRLGRAAPRRFFSLFCSFLWGARWGQGGDAPKSEHAGADFRSPSCSAAIRLLRGAAEIRAGWPANDWSNPPRPTWCRRWLGLLASGTIGPDIGQTFSSVGIAMFHSDRQVDSRSLSGLALVPRWRRAFDPFPGRLYRDPAFRR